MTAKNLKKSRVKRAGHVTNAAGSGASPMKKTAVSQPSMSSLVALNDVYILEEDPISISDTGLSTSVEDAIKNGKLIIPERYENFAEKYPCTGKIISKGPETKYEELQVGTRVMFARLGVQRWKLNGRTICNCKEQEIHGIFLD